MFGMFQNSFSTNGNSNVDENIYIQVQDITGNWRTYNFTINNPHMILSNMQNLSSQFPDQRVRAVDSNNRLVDMM